MEGSYLLAGQDLSRLLAPKKRGRKLGGSNSLRYPARDCSWCGSSFLPKQTRSKLCSRACHDALRRADDRAKGRRRDPAEQKRALCEDCGRQCSAYSKRCKPCDNAKARPRSMRQAQCQGCGAQFSRSSRTRNAMKYCSRACAFTNHRQWRSTPPLNGKPRAVGAHCKVHPCRSCGRVIRANRKQCEACKRAPSQRTCAMCSRLFSRPYGYGSHKFCSEDCSALSAKCSKTKARRRRRTAFGKSWRSIAKSYGVPYEPVNRIRVFERDGWLCQLCGKPTNLKVHYLHNRAPSLDHRTPISRGGSHTYANTQCAHRICNSLKSDKSERGQLPLWNQ